MRKRINQIIVRLDADENEQLKKKVKKTGLSQEAFIRSLIDGYAPKQLPPPDYHAMMKQLRAIGNRVNQIAVKANTTGFIHAKEYAAITDELREAMLRIQAAVTQPERIKDAGG